MKLVLQWGQLSIFLVLSMFVCAQEIDYPVPWGGNKLLKEFISEEMVYPDIALKNKIEGVVKLSFTVNKDGSISDLSVENPVSPEIDAEALRIFGKILWNPAVKMGKKINFQYYYKIPFNIKKYRRYCKSRGYEDIVYPHKPYDNSNKIYHLKELTRAPTPVLTSRDYNINVFIANNLKYPEAAFKQSVSGVVKLKFVVEPSGRISNIKTLSTVGGGCTEEAIRVIRLLRWNPGLLDNMAVRTFMTMEITFNVAEKTVKGKIPTPGQVY